MKYRTLWLAAWMLAACMSNVPAAENVGDKTKTAEAEKDLRLRLMNKAETAKVSGRKAGTALRIGQVFGNGMILQRNRPVRIGGFAAPGSEVKLEFAGQELQTRANAAGVWLIEMKPLAASNRPQTMRISSGKEKLVFSDVLVGDVWLATGQSNMVCSANLKIHEYKTRTSFFKEKAPALQAKMEKFAEWNEPEIRFYTPSAGVWKKCVGKDAMACSLVAMFFARKLHETLKVPIGLVNVAYGCATIETYMPLEVLEAAGYHDQVKEGLAYQEVMKKGGPAKLDPAAREKLLLEHCHIPLYRFCRPFVGKDGKVDPKKYRTIEWHMSVVKPGAVFLDKMVKVLDFPFLGVIWYQGETNVGFKGYEVKQRLLVEYLRRLTRDPGMPFYAVMVTPRNTLADFWSQQYAAVADTPGTALVNTADTPPEEQLDYHPSTKDFVGERLALIALNKTYGMKDVVYSGPIFDGAEVSGTALLVSFRYGKGLHTLDGKAPLCFQIAGEDKKFVPANAVIEGERIRLSAANVPSPKYARYAWAAKNTGLNVVNGANLPLYPFDSSDPFFRSAKLKKMHE